MSAANDGIQVLFGGLPGVINVGASYIMDTVADWLPLVPSSADYEAAQDALGESVRDGDPLGDVTGTIRDVSEDARAAAERVQDTFQFGLTVAAGLTIATTLFATTALLVGAGVFVSQVDVKDLIAGLASKAVTR